MAKLPPLLAIESKIEGCSYPNEQRPYLGMSQLGHSCARYLWYSFRWAYIEMLTAKQKRIFARGHLEEAQVVEDLVRAGCSVTGQQTSFVGFAGHIKGHCDGIVHDLPDAPVTPHLLEIKTMNDASFKKCRKDGVKKSYPVYYGQLQLYMHYLELTRALFVATNKNSQERYYERVHLVQEDADLLLSKGEDIICNEVPPRKIGDVTWFECKYCAAASVCHRGEAPHKSCRTCRNVNILDGGRWHCSLHDEELTNAKQSDGCEDYTLSPFISD
jgi:hypothetical protein